MTNLMKYVTHDILVSSKIIVFAVCDIFGNIQVVHLTILSILKSEINDFKQKKLEIQMTTFLEIVFMRFR
jgi:hypothetical protein